MLLRITYSNTKRFLKSTIQNLKSYFAGGYQKLPKTPPCNPFSCTCSGGAAGIQASRFNHNCIEPEITTNHYTKTTFKETSNMKLEEQNLINNQHQLDIRKQQENNLVKHEDESLSKCFVTRKLKELKMMDQNNVDLVLDIEEVLHYYSRLTCPVYRDIIEKFFVEMYSGTFVLSRVENSVSKKLLI